MVVTIGADLQQQGWRTAAGGTTTGACTSGCRPSHSRNTAWHLAKLAYWSCPPTQPGRQRQLGPRPAHAWHQQHQQPWAGLTSSPPLIGEKNWWLCSHLRVWACCSRSLLPFFRGVPGGQGASCSRVWEGQGKSCRPVIPAHRTPCRTGYPLCASHPAVPAPACAPWHAHCHPPQALERSSGSGRRRRRGRLSQTAARCLDCRTLDASASERWGWQSASA